MFTACSHCKPFDFFFFSLNFYSLTGKKIMFCLQSLSAWSFLVQVSWSFFIYVMESHISLVSFSFSPSFRTSLCLKEFDSLFLLKESQSYVSTKSLLHSFYWITCFPCYAFLISVHNLYKNVAVEFVNMKK